MIVEAIVSNVTVAEGRWNMSAPNKVAVRDAMRVVKWRVDLASSEFIEDHKRGYLKTHCLSILDPVSQHHLGFVVNAVNRLFRELDSRLRVGVGWGKYIPK